MPRTANLRNIAKRSGRLSDGRGGQAGHPAGPPSPKLDGACKATQEQEARSSAPSTAPAAELRAALSCCARCALRFSGARDSAWYTPDEAALDELVPPATAADASPAACPLCLGLLQERFCLSAARLDALAAQVAALGYSTRTWLLALNLPVGLLVRQRAAWLHLRAREPPLPPAHMDEAVDVKDALRWTLIGRLAPRAGEFDAGSPLTLQLSAEHVGPHGHATATEHHEVLRALLPPPSAHEQHKRQRLEVPSDVDAIRSVRRAALPRCRVAALPPPSPPRRRRRRCG